MVAPHIPVVFVIAVISAYSALNLSGPLNRDRRHYLSDTPILRDTLQRAAAADGVWRIWQGSVSRHGLLDRLYPLREHLNSVQQMVSGEYCEGAFPQT